MKNLVRYLALQQISQNETFKSAFETETGGHFVPKRDFASGLVHDSHVVVQAFRRHPVLFSIGTAALLALAGTAALRTIPAGDFVAPVWPGTGLGVALAIICGLRIAPAIWIGAFISQIHFGESIPTSILLATMELSDALLPWLLLKSFAPDFGTDLRRIRDVAGLLIASPVIACGFTAFIGTALLNHPGGSWTQWYLPGVFQWWVGTASGSTIVAPLILVLSTRAFATPSRYTLMTRLSLAGMILAILGLNFFVFHGEFAESALYSVYPLALIAALVFGPRGTAATTLVCSLIAITATVFGLGPFIQANEPPEWTELQVFIDLFAVSGLLLSATKSERDDAVLGLRASHASLETKVSARTKQLVEEKASLELLQKVAAFASASLDSDTTLHDSLDVMRDFGGWDAAHVLLPASRDNSEVLCSSGIWSLRANGGDFSELLKEISQSSIAPNEGIPGRVVQTGDALQYCPVSSAPDCIRKQSLVRAGIHSTALLPITVGDRVRGILEFYRRDEVLVDDEKMTVLGHAATVLGRAMERRDAQMHLATLASVDSLTGLPNRAAFLETVGRSLRRSSRDSNSCFGLIFVDLDRFKVVNDSLGHRAGDILLQTVADRMQKCLRGGDMVARLGGDEFVVLLETSSAEKSGMECVQAARRIAASVAEPIEVEGESLQIEVSMGIALSHTGYEDAATILRDADTAMYKAKRDRTRKIQLFDPEMHTATVHRLKLEGELRTAVERDEFVVHYQPVVSLSTRLVVGFEALVRWNHPTRGLLLPGEFIPLAEETRLINPLGSLVLRTACEWLVSVLPLATPNGLTIAVNVSAHQLSDPSFVDTVAKILTETGLPGSALCLEITESVVMREPEEAIHVLESLRALGIKIHIDDFGTGYSSLAYLARLPIDSLKVDRTFVRDIHTNASNFEIVRSIANLAVSLGKHVVAEGVESPMQAEFLLGLGCEFGQGYLFSKPISGRAAAALLGTSRRDIRAKFEKLTQSA